MYKYRTPGFLTPIDLKKPNIVKVECKLIDDDYNVLLIDSKNRIAKETDHYVYHDDFESARNHILKLMRDILKNARWYENELLRVYEEIESMKDGGKL